MGGGDRVNRSLSILVASYNGSNRTNTTMSHVRNEETKVQLARLGYEARFLFLMLISLIGQIATSQQKKSKGQKGD